MDFRAIRVIWDPKETEATLVYWASTARTGPKGSKGSSVPLAIEGQEVKLARREHWEFRACQGTPAGRGQRVRWDLWDPQD